MFRRRRMLRPIIPVPVPMGVPAGGRPPVNPAVARAHQLMAAGQYAGAAAAFSQITSVAHARGGPRAPFFSVQAGRAFILAGQMEPGMAHVNQGLQWLAEAGRWPDLGRVGHNVVAQLTDLGYAAEAQSVQAWLDATLAGKAVAMPAAGKAARPVLPTHCPGCGAGVNPKEVEWVDDLTALCDFCGSPIRAEA